MRVCACVGGVGVVESDKQNKISQSAMAPKVSLSFNSAGEGVKREGRREGGLVNVLLLSMKNGSVTAGTYSFTIAFAFAFTITNGKCKCNELLPLQRLTKASLLLSRHLPPPEGVVY